MEVITEPNWRASCCCVTRLPFFCLWNTAGYLKSLAAVALCQGLVQVENAKLAEQWGSVVTTPFDYMCIYIYISATDLFNKLLGSFIPFEPPPNSSATQSQPNTGSWNGFPNSHKDSFLLSLACWKESELHLQIGGTRWLYMGLCIQGTPPLQLSVDKHPVLICHYGPQQWKGIQYRLREKGMPNKRHNLIHL